MIRNEDYHISCFIYNVELKRYNISYCIYLLSL